MVGLGLTFVPGDEFVRGGMKGAKKVRKIIKPVKPYYIVRPSAAKITAKQATKEAASLGFKKTNYFVNGQPVFKKGNKYITPDIDSHSGGAWKMASSVQNLKSKQTRMDTYDKNLRRVGR